mmetsp:Transcript_16161/g.46414  ORF Transcript_16161/g.46414 Transcript_16161/m.46414 type:complete len:353 (+) Transcript_16161:143-1201(+)
MRRQIQGYPLVLFLVLCLAAAAVAPTVHSFPFRLQPWKQQVGQHQATERRRRPPGLSELFGANGSEGSDDVGSDDNNGANDQKKARSGPAPVSSFEEMVRKMTQNPDYKFGDLTRSAVSVGTHAVEDVVQKATGKDDYHFGDITKGTISKVSKTSTNVLTYSEKTLSLMREADVHELVELTRFFWTSNMNYEQKRETFVVGVYFGAVLVLAYNFVANINAGLVNAAAWTMASIKLGTSPLSGSVGVAAATAAGGGLAGGWGTFLRAQKTLDMAFGGPFLPARVAITIPVFFRYQHWIRKLEGRFPLKNKYPILNRVATLLTMWIGLNLVTYVGVSVGFAWVGSRIFSGIPLR